MAVRRAAAPLCCRRRGEVKERELFYGSRAVAKLLPVKLRPRDCCPGGNQDGSPSERSCLCATRVGGGDIGFDGPFMRPEFFCHYCRFPRVVYSILRHQRRCVDLALVKLCIALNSFDSGDGCVRNIIRSEECIVASLCCILLSRGVIVVPVRKLEIQFGIEAALSLLFDCAKVFSFGVSRK